ncbi:MAG: ABC transporter substrate-binding protein [Candidatus Paceibacterota bacterium]
MNKKIIWTILVVIIIVVIIALFGRSKPVEGTIRVAAAIPLTGNYASIGEKIKNGLEAARADIEAKDGTKVEIVYEDACLPKEITSAVQKLINIDKITIINQFCAVGIVPALVITEPAKVISVEIAANVDDLLGKQYFFSPNFAVRDNAKTIAEFAVNDLKAKKAAFIYYNTQFGKDYTKYTSARFKELGGTVVADEMTNLDVMDFKTNLAKIKVGNPDVIFVTQLTGALATIIKQARDQGLDIPIVGNYQNEDPTVLSAAGPAAEGFIISSADPAILSANYSAFRESFEEVYKVQPDVFASNAYDALHIEVAAMKKCGNDTDCIRSEIHKIKDYKGVSGTITINADGVAVKPTVFKVVKDGKFVLYNQ